MPADTGGAANPGGAAAIGLKRLVHRSIASVTNEIERLHFNKAVALVRELSNAIEAFTPGTSEDRAVLREATLTLVQLIGPMLPHLAEELWQRLGQPTILADTAWPVADPAWLVADSVTLALQVNGKRRGEIQLPAGSDEALVRERALADEAVIRAMAGKEPRRVIVVPDRIVNVVV